jgi:A/G-specific adenine glycosylase
MLQNFYKENKRSSLPWRKTKGVYKILVSEIMLQQTQVGRVLVKYTEFLTRFPSVESLAKAPLRDVLILWQGLGYNRRAKFLHEASKKIVEAKPSELKSYTFLCSLPGVGQSTAGAVFAFTQNKPVVFIETNIRAVILHHFFEDIDSHGEEKVPDVQIQEVLKKLIERLPKDFGPRDFYYALYDYGTYLKQTLGVERKRLHQKSTSYTKQSKFAGSRRQLRAFILKLFLEMTRVHLDKKGFKKILVERVLKMKPEALKQYTQTDIETLVEELETEGMFI